jgi:hypothetical protein
MQHVMPWLADFAALVAMTGRHMYVSTDPVCCVKLLVTACRQHACHQRKRQIQPLGLPCLTWYVSVTSCPDSRSCLTSSWLRPTSSGLSFLRMLYRM